MKYAFYCFIISLIYLISFASSTILCKDNETNAEFIAEDSDISVRLEKLLNNFEITMNDLSKQMLNSMHALESKVENLTGKIENISLVSDANNKIIKKDETILDAFRISAKNCKDAMKNNQEHHSIYKIQLSAISPQPIEVVCDERHGGNWIVVMRRFNHSVNFNRNWNEYKTGFGNLAGEFFIGMDKLHAITNSGPKHELLIDMITAENITKYIKYTNFVIGSETEGYKLSEFGDYHGNAQNEFKDYLGMKFTTKDVDNDLWNNGNCCSVYRGAWWFRDCGVSSLFKMDLKWHPDLLKSADVLIRPAN